MSTITWQKVRLIGKENSSRAPSVDWESIEFYRRNLNAFFMSKAEIAENGFLPFDWTIRKSINKRVNVMKTMNKQSIIETEIKIGWSWFNSWKNTNNALHLLRYRIASLISNLEKLEHCNVCSRNLSQYRVTETHVTTAMTAVMVQLKACVFCYLRSLAACTDNNFDDKTAKMQSTPSKSDLNTSVFSPVRCKYSSIVPQRVQFSILCNFSQRKSSTPEILAQRHNWHSATNQSDRQNDSRKPSQMGSGTSERNSSVHCNRKM